MSDLLQNHMSTIHIIRTHAQEVWDKSDEDFYSIALFCWTVTVGSLQYWQICRLLKIDWQLFFSYSFYMNKMQCKKAPFLLKNAGIVKLQSLQRYSKVLVEQIQMKICTTIRILGVFTKIWSLMRHSSSEPWYETKLQCCTVYVSYVGTSILSGENEIFKQTNKHTWSLTLGEGINICP